MRYVIGVDVGGTFTDAVAADRDGRLVAAKSPSTPPDYGRGVLAALDELADRLGIGLDELLADTAYIAHGTTSTLNALVTGQVAKVGFLTTRGHRDSIFIMNVEGRYLGRSPYEIQDSLRTRKPTPLVPKWRAREVTERIDYKGSIVVALDETEARVVIGELLDEGVEAIAVSLLWSFRNPAHERRLRELIHEQAPDLYVSLSSELSPRIREFSRHATTIMSTQVGPTLARYLGELEDALRGRGLQAQLLVMQGSGGSISAAEAPASAITTVGSILTGGVVGASRLAEQLGHRNVISTDVGGTTFLVGLVVDGEPVRTSTMVINQHPVNVSSLKVALIGSGGGAIAGVDAGGNLRVGPNSAGADPGPACYGQGGENPTNTDAALMLGILNEDYFLGGRRRLSRDLAEKALLERVGRPLGLSAAEAAAAVFAVQNAQTADLVRKVVVESGHDPRDFVLYAFGGAGPVHCAAYAADLGVESVVVPLGATAAAFSAFGLVTSSVAVTAELSDPANVPVPAEQVQANFERLEQEVAARLARQGIAFTSTESARELDIRYALQLNEVTTPVPSGALDDEAVAEVGATFEALYARLYGAGSGFREAGMQFITYRVRGVGRLPFAPVIPDSAPAGRPDATEALKARRPVCLDLDTGFVDTPIYDYARLGAGHVLTGPAVVEVPTTTVVVPPGTEAELDRVGNLVIRFR